MDAPVKDLERIEALQQEGRQRLDAGQPAEALRAVEQALVLEPKNLRSLTLKADVLESLHKDDAAQQMRALVKQIKREQWQREVEAEVRGHHELMGEAIRHEKL
ncbi:MAG TPA: hypothetical protein VKB51_14320 [bacterium]|nr:hypothetical protein [bacterium]